MLIRHFTDADCTQLNTWWVAQGESPKPSSLTPLESSFLIEDEAGPAVAVSIWLTNTPVAMVENLISRPKLSRTHRRNLVNQLFIFIQSWAKARGYQAFMTSSNVGLLVERYKEMGWEPLPGSFSVLGFKLG